MVGYKLSKNDWVTPFFVIFRSVREKLLVTVFLDHPVSVGKDKPQKLSDVSGLEAEYIPVISAIKLLTVVLVKKLWFW